jgi:hypothetical protein
MSMELYVATTSTELPSADQIGAKLKSLGVTLVVEPFDWSDQSGFLPMVIEGHQSGVEVDLWGAAESGPTLAAFGVPAAPGTRIVAFRWGSQLAECACALATAAGIASLTDGRILEPDAGEIISAEKALADVRDCVNGIA